MTIENLTKEFSEGEALEQIDQISRTGEITVLDDGEPAAMYLDWSARIEPQLRELGIAFKADSTRRMNFVLGWADSEWGDEGRLIRNRMARRLRKVGYEVDVDTVSFMDLARDASYLLEAHWPMSKKPPFGADTHYQHKVD